MEESNASIIVDSITKEWLGTIGGLLAVLGVIGRSYYQWRYRFAFSSFDCCRFYAFGTKKYSETFIDLYSYFAVTIGILLYSQRDAAGFDMIWRYLLV